jgi:Carboxypeptidase regulatory-like domain
MPLIVGRIRNDVGEPQEGVRVMITRAPVPIPDVALLTGPDGAFTLSAPVFGSYEITCASDRNTRKVQVDLSGEHVDVDVTL